MRDLLSAKKSDILYRFSGENVLYNILYFHPERNIRMSSMQM